MGLLMLELRIIQYNRIGTYHIGLKLNVFPITHSIGKGGSY